MCKEYNGWTNYQTWNVKLWLDNNGDDSMMRDIARNSKEETHPRHYVSENIKEYIQGMNPLEGDSGMFCDILQSALDDVDWDAIADAYIGDVTDEEDSQVCYYCGDEVDGEHTDSDGDVFCEECYETEYIKG